jgi:CheY-like chemotaxis protein
MTADAERPAARQVLVVDADADTRALYRECVASDGYECAEAADGQEAIARARTHPPMLVITEIRLPVMDGYDLCGMLRGDRATSHAAILIVTSDAVGEHLDRARKAGADAVLVKPTTPDALRSEVRRLLSAAAGDGGGAR